MTRKKLPFWKILIVGAIAEWVLGGFAFALPSSTHFLSSRSTRSTPERSSPGNVSLRNSLHAQAGSTPPDFSDVGRPRRRRGGGSRGPCLIADKPPLTALVPNTSTGLTIATAPKFWFYVPYPLTSDHAVEFVLKNDQDNTVYTTNFPGGGTSPGIVSLPIPSTVSLAVNKRYEWYFLIYCDAQNRDRFVFVNGVVQRIEKPDLQRQLAALPIQEQTILYDDQGLWYDALNNLAEQLRVAPQDRQIREEWTSLLKSVGLENLASEPFVPCCTTD